MCSRTVLARVTLLLFATGCVPSAPAWSPDGTRIAFAAPTELSHTLWVFDAGTGEEIARWITEEVVLAPRWSPDGRLTFVTVPEMRGGFRRATYWSWRPGDDRPVRTLRAATDGRGVYALSTEWSAGGAALRTILDRRHGRYEVWLDPPRGRRRPILRGAGDVALPRWSPDGARIAYLARAGAPGVWDLRVADASGGGDRSLVPAVLDLGSDEDALPPGDLFAPSWSPGGESIAFVRAVPTGLRRKVRGEIRIADLDGAHVLFAAPEGGTAASPSWASSGLIAYAARYGDEEPQVVFAPTIFPPGENLVRLATTFDASPPLAGGLMPVPAPDGRRIAWLCGSGPERVVRIHDVPTGTDTWLATTPEGAAAVEARRR